MKQEYKFKSYENIFDLIFSRTCHQCSFNILRVHKPWNYKISPLEAKNKPEPNRSVQMKQINKIIKKIKKGKLTQGTCASLV